jgi:hypothetical protein
MLVLLVAATKIWAVKQAHLLAWPTGLVSLPALFVPDTIALVKVDFFVN